MARKKRKADGTSPSAENKRTVSLETLEKRIRQKEEKISELQTDLSGLRAELDSRISADLRSVLAERDLKYIDVKTAIMNGDIKPIPEAEEVAENVLPVAQNSAETKNIEKNVEKESEELL